MKPRTARIWRLWLIVVAAGVLLVGALSCFFGLYFHRTSSAGATFGVSVTRGALYVVRTDNRDAARPPAKGTHVSLEPVAGTPRVALIPSGQLRRTAGAISGFNACLPLWIPLLALGGPAAWMWWKHVRRPPGQCDTCGYDLRGTPPGRCPECGTETSKATSREATAPRARNLWRLRRMFLRPVAYGIALSLVLAAASSYFYVYAKVWMFGPEDVMLVGLSSRTLCVQRIDYMPAVRDQISFNMWHKINAPTPEYWPTTRWLDAGWLGDNRWETAWFPMFARRTNGWIVAVPWWNMAVAGVGFLVALHYLQSRAFCRHCGYDLKDLPGQICPECGNTFRGRTRGSGA